ncbi:Mor transcription activator family protein [Methylobacter sp. BBA5.1]|uniref:Mor transcription activator family protein n=1 Tax=Methylobacter sp. BBA5.1 TaxID=1495064 RepID=UPI000AFA1288|nr:Mor transcription activator family protein [Methylobacter sp. BBA5.1]
MSDQIDQIAADIETIAVKFGLSEQLASDLSSAVIERIRSNLGGETYYIPKVDKQRRNNLIRSRFNGVNHADICSAFNISKSTLYRILARNMKPR